MAAPSPTTRSTPAGIKLKDGFGTKITIGLDPDISFWEKRVKPAGIDNGDEIDQTTNFNTDWMTKAPQSINERTGITGVCAYDPAVETQLEAVVGVETVITVRHPDGTTEADYGYLKSFIPQEQSKGQQPEADFEIVLTCFDPTNKVEAGPAVASVAGT